MDIDKSKFHDFPKSPQAWANWINQCHAKAISDRQPYEFQWAINTAYYHGFQHLLYNQQMNYLTRDLDNDELVINRIAPFVETRVAKIIRTKPILIVTPNNLSQQAIKGAEFSEGLLKHLWRVNKKDQKATKHALLCVLMGSAFKKVSWDPDEGEYVEEPLSEDGHLEFDEKGEHMKNKIFMGEIDNCVKSAWDILASPGALDVQSAEWIIERSHMTTRAIKQMDYKDLDPDKLTSFNELTNYERFVYRMASPMYTNISGWSNTRVETSSNMKEHEQVLVKEFWMKPNDIYTRGVLATVIGDQLVQFEEWPHKHGMYPYVKTDEKLNPFSFYGTSPVTRIIPVQRRYNKGRTQLSRNIALLANGKVLAAKGHGMSDEAFTDEEGEIVEYNPNVPAPQQMQIAPLPNYITNAMDLDLLDIRDISGEREASQNPFPNITAGVAMETASEIADIPLGPTLRNFETGYIQEGVIELHLANQFYNDIRKLKISGPNNEIKVIEFRNIDLQNQVDVQVQVESALGNIRGIQQQKLVDLWDRRIVSDPNLFLKAYMTGSLDVILKSQEPSEHMIIEDINAIKEGQAPMINPFDNHVLYVRRLSEFIQTPEFRRLAPDRQMLAMQVLQQHLLAIQPVQEAQPNPAAVNTPYGSQVTEGAV